MNLLGHAYFEYLRLRGSSVPRHYREYLEAESRPIAPELSRGQLARLLQHCRDQVPYYGEIMRDLPDLEDDPVQALRRMPLLTKRIIRERFEDLKSRDLDRRRWFENTSGGSTGEPVRFIQDAECASRTGALALAFSRWVGHEVGEPQVLLWGSERDVLQGTVGLRNQVANALKRTTFLNAFRMTPDAMREFVRVLRRVRPRLFVAYAQALYELAGFVESNALEVPPVGAVITSAGTLHDFMRARIERVFRCRVYDRYGSREVGLIAAERPGVEGMWVPPWNVFVEIVDDDARCVPDGVDGDIAITLLSNHAMPLVRYRIGDRGALGRDPARGGRVLTRLLGRNVDAFRRRDGTVVDGEYFTHLLYFRPWVEKFQFVQTSYDEVVVRIVARDLDRRSVQPELAEMASQTRAALGNDTELRVEWVDEIPPAPSGKYRYTVSQVAAPS